LSSIFTRILRGEIPCYKVAENDSAIAFLDIAPLVKGHTLVVPKNEVDAITMLNDEEYLSLFLLAKQVGIAVQRYTGAARTGMVVAGFEVPHAHIHLLPVNAMHEMHFENARLSFTTEEYKAIAEGILGCMPE
jgi:histidine triad (HIT) family protein